MLVKTKPAQAPINKSIFGGKRDNVKVINVPNGMAKAEVDAVVKLYRYLASDLDSCGTVDVGLIVNEGFAKFAETLGEKDFEKVKRYFGIGSYGKSKGNYSSREIDSLVSRLRTMENACCYISGYRDMINDIASKLSEAPEYMSNMVKAKLVRMFFTVFAGYYFFIEDLAYSPTGRAIIDAENAPSQDKKMLYPEELMLIYKKSLKSYSVESIIYGMLINELNMLSTKSLRKEILEIFELKENSDGTFVSTNVARTAVKFSTLRTLRNKIHLEPGTIALETFVCLDYLTNMSFNQMYTVYKAVTDRDVEDYPTVKFEVQKFEGTRFVKIPYSCRHLKTSDYNTKYAIAGPIEAKRFINIMNWLVDKNALVKAFEFVEGWQMFDAKKMINHIDVAMYMGAINFLRSIGIVTPNTDPLYDMQSADKLIKSSCKRECYSEYVKGNISDEALMAILGTSLKDIKEMFGIVEEKKPEEVIYQIAIDEGLSIGEDSSEVMNLIQEYIVPGNEQSIKAFQKGEIDLGKLKKDIGFEEEFEDMYFNLSNVDIQAIEEKLKAYKNPGRSNKEMKKSALIINLYIYIIENSIACGPKHKVPKRNKSLKTSILKKLVQAAV